MADAELSKLKTLLSPEEIITIDSPNYDSESRTWAIQANKHPAVVVIPKDLETLSKVVSYANTTSLDIGVRCTGIGSASAKDVLISLSAFKSFSFDRSQETITFGAGHNWGEIDQKVEEQAPGYAAVSARCTYVGVGGSILHGGQSWLSSEHGLSSDPQNLLDAQVVKLDGSVLWASKEPDLLWALRGGGGGFGVVVAYKMRVYKYPSSIFCGQIIYPPEALHDIARETAAFASRCSDPKVAMHLYCLDMTAGTYAGKEPKPGLAIFAYDANGPEHGRSKDGFKWALEIPGAVDLTKTSTFREVNQAFDQSKAPFGKINTWAAGVTVPAVNEELILRAWDWYLALLKKDSKLVMGTYVLMEVMQKAVYQSLGFPSLVSAWPHTRNQHNLQLGTGVVPGSPESDALAHKAMAEGPYEIRPGHTGADYFPNFIEDFVDPKKVFGVNWDRLVEVKRKYDPNNKLGDEGKPTCERCNAANVECAGYEQRRQIEPQPSRTDNASTSATPRSAAVPGVSASASPNYTIRHANSFATVYPKFRTDGLPLIALPTNPRSDQRPHARARDILAYQQYLFRTLPLLFPAEHLHFWRDRLCEEAWDIEYIFLTIAALGGVHRAVLMMSTPSKHDTSRGLDTKVIAVQTYTEALQRISELSLKTDDSLDVFVAALVLLAYFEVVFLFGNIPAAIGHTNEAVFYFSRMRFDDPILASFGTAIYSALKNLRAICHIMLPLPNLGTMDSLAERFPALPGLHLLSPSSSHADPGIRSAPLLDLLDFADRHPEVNHLIWDPLAVYERTISPNSITTFRQHFNNWTISNNPFSQFDSQTLGALQVECDWDAIDRLVIPPRPYADAPAHRCVFAAVHSFYMARMYWVLSLSGNGHEDEKCYLGAYHYIYEVMRSVATIINHGQGVNDMGEGYLACETLGVGLLPLMHILGQCCPKPTWLRWIMEQLSGLGQEGLFNGHVLAKSLNALYTFEMSNNLDSSSMLDHFPPPSSRVISVLLPELDGQSYTAFYASPSFRQQGQVDVTLQYVPLGHARWLNVRRGGTTKPNIEMYTEERKHAEPFTRSWLLEQKVSIEWTTWSTQVGFNFDRALRDHISGSCLENAVYEQEVR
ncbi:hypothetical protein H2200_013628 [Cladophialophora chaetospira]|uniref:FAD-binding PCMH-type domain-containing protein n=1 Tax=Cladophialophora chaetospira TaxID=386627 RepID=A0AA38TXA2_9EURO|nr:hypothetical protein H2200_013628 [Cladophialophora chaetospira]